MPIFNTSNPFKSSSSSTQTSARRGPPRKNPPSSSNPSRRPQQPPPPSPRLVSLDQLASLTSRLQQLKSSFIQPPTLNFNPKSSTREQPKLEYDKNNAPFHAYDEALTKLLIELDGIDSCGEEEIRLKRKGLVLEVERELERLDGVRKEEYKKQLAGGKREEGKEGETEKEGRRETVANGSQGESQFISTVARVAHTHTLWHRSTLRISTTLKFSTLATSSLKSLSTHLPTRSSSTSSRLPLHSTSPAIPVRLLNSI